MKRVVARFVVPILCFFGPGMVFAQPDADAFKTPPRSAHPETWFHLIGGNVSQELLTTDLEAVAGAGFRGIQLFHGRGTKWPGISPQITCLSPAWDGMIAHVGRETERLQLQFAMQNCPGWAMSGGPWISPENAMRHLVWSRTDVTGGTDVSLALPRPQPSQEAWRDYRDVAVLAFPTPADDPGTTLIPSRTRSNRDDLPWNDLFAETTETRIRLQPAEDPVWVEVFFAEPTYLRTLELPPTDLLMMRRIFDPDTTVRVEALTDQGRIGIGRRAIPRGTWQDKLPEIPVVLTFSDTQATGFRITFENNQPMELSYLRLFSAARIHDWCGQAGFVLHSLDRSPPPDQAEASWVRAASILDLTSHLDGEGNLSWAAPVGNWTVVRFGHVNTGVKNKPAPPEATGFECNKLSPVGADHHFAGYIGRLSKPGGPVAGELDGMLIDSWECFTQTWTEAMEQEFEQRRGYPLRRWLPALAGWVVDDHDRSERFLRDWRCTISDLLVKNYFGRLAELGRERGLKLSFETAVGDISPGDILHYYSQADIPMCEFWQPNDPHWGGFETKMIHPTTSAAHIYGKPIVAAEAFTNVGITWDEHPYMLKHQADRHFALGINHLIFHTYTHNPAPDVRPGTSFGSRIGTPFLRGQTWWKHMPHFTEYLARCEFMLQQGQPVADVLWYLGDDLDHKPRQDRPFPAGYQFDYLNFDALVHRIHVVDGRLQTAEGATWEVLWLPAVQCRRLTPATLTRIRDLLHQGATVVGEAPATNPSLAGGSIDGLVRELWGMTPAASGDRHVGEGRLLWGDELATTLDALGIQPDVSGMLPARWCHRTTVEAEIYFIAADRVTPLQANLSFRAGGTPEFWDPMTGTTSPVTVYHQDGGRIRIPINLPAAGSMFVLFRRGAGNPPVVRIERDGSVYVDATDPTRRDQSAPYPRFGLTPGEVLQPWVEPSPLACSIIGEDLLAWDNGTYTLTRSDGTSATRTVTGAHSIALDSPWSLSFPSGWDAPEQVDLPSLLPWSGLTDPATRAFSGTATYHTTLDLAASVVGQPLILDLGRVADIAEVMVNDEHVATLWAPPFRADVAPSVRAGTNHIEIKVTNTWRNRLIYDAGLPRAERRTWTISAPAATDTLIDAGLLGPVRLHVGRRVPPAVPGVESRHTVSPL